MPFHKVNKFLGKHGKMVYILDSDPAALGLIPEIFSEENIVNVSKVSKQRRCLESNGQWLENVDLELASGHKPVLQKVCEFFAQS